MKLVSKEWKSNRQPTTQQHRSVQEITWLVLLSQSRAKWIKTDHRHNGFFRIYKKRNLRHTSTRGEKKAYFSFSSASIQPELLELSRLLDCSASQFPILLDWQGNWLRLVFRDFDYFRNRDCMLSTRRACMVQARTFIRGRQGGSTTVSVFVLIECFEIFHSFIRPFTWIHLCTWIALISSVATSVFLLDADC